MNPSLPPIPPPAPYYCQNCGAPVQTLLQMCPHCGARVVPRAVGPSVFATLGAIVLMLSGGALGLYGSCLLLIALPALMGGQGTTSARVGAVDSYGWPVMGGPGEALAWTAYALVSLGGAALCLWGLNKLVKRK